jgi:DNA repair exonuclease SbcCD ATPase subunit
MEFSKHINKLKTEQEVLEKELSNHQERLDACLKEKQSAEDARSILQLAAKKTQENLEYHFSDLVTKAFGIVFDEPYEFVMDFVERRNKTECDLWFKSGKRLLKPDYGVGGGVVDVASFATRIAYWRLENSAPILVLDEPFKNLSNRKNKQLLSRAVEMLKMLSDEFNVQMLINTHIPEITQQADRVFEIENGRVV